MKALLANLSLSLLESGDIELKLDTVDPLETEKVLNSFSDELETAFTIRKLIEGFAEKSLLIDDYLSDIIRNT